MHNCFVSMFVGKLNQQTQTKLLVRIPSMGRESLDFAKQLAADDFPDKTPPPLRELPWCRPMDTQQETICCTKRVQFLLVEMGPLLWPDVKMSSRQFIRAKYT